MPVTHKKNVSKNSDLHVEDLPMNNTPLQELSYREEVVPVDVINRGVGISESAESIAKLLTKMCLRSEVAEGGRSVKIEIPPTRAGK